ncbi:SLBB domain-containing protein [uncultured Rubinisphaera sp.]|uniref:polysaccharide biosynthesis/export family protein n=1 Tax=uncultured Rubinisphaera sp. TaxID=1678686 RepID=UPI0030DC0584
MIVTGQITKSMRLCGYFFAFLIGAFSVSLCQAAPKIIQFDSQKSSQAASSTVAIIGAVNEPGTYQLQSPTITLAEMVTQAGGLTETAGQKVQIVRGGRAGIVLFYQSQTDYLLRAGDVVVIAEGSPSRAKVISYDHENTNGKSTANALVVRATHHQPATPKSNYGHIVLIGLQDHAVVMPLWKPELTTDDLLTTWLKQPAEVAQGVQLIAGPRSRGESNALNDGMVLHVPSRLVDGNSLPRLPSILEGQSRQESSTQKPVKEYHPESQNQNSWLKENGISTDLQPVPLTHNAPAKVISEPEPLVSVPEFSLPTLMNAIKPTPQNNMQAMRPEPRIDSPLQDPSMGLMVIPQESAPKADNTSSQQKSAERRVSNHSENENQKDEASSVPSFETTFDNFVEDSFLAENTSDSLLSPVNNEEFHLAAADEVIPNPIEASQPSQSSLIGLIAGGIVIIGVITVIIASVKTHLEQSPYSSNEELNEEPDVKVRESKSPVKAPVVESRQKSVSVTASEEEVLLQALTEDRLPTIEERVLMPREMQFFGKPHLHYEFRVDAAHDIPKPHILAPKGNAESKSKIGAGPKHHITREDVQWQGQTGFDQVPSDYFQQTTPNLR